MTTLMKTLAASAATLALAACANTAGYDTVGLDDSQQIGVSDNDRFATAGGQGMTELDDKFKVDCNDNDRFQATGCENVNMASTTMTTRTETLASGTATVLELISSSPQHERLENAIKAAGLDDDLMEMSNFTIFAPTDTAFSNASLRGLSDDADLEMLLKNHIIDGRYLAADVVALIPEGQFYSVPTVGGMPVQTYLSNGELRLVNGGGVLLPVLSADMIATNGVVHVIDQVLMPDIDTPDLVNE